MEKIAMNALIFFGVGIVLMLLIGEDLLVSIGIMIMLFLSVITALLIELVQLLKKSK